MRTEQKLILAVGVLAGGFALSLPFHREAPSARPPKSPKPGFSRDLNLTLRRDTIAVDPNQPNTGRPLPPPLARITAVPDEERAAARKKETKEPVPTPTSTPTKEQGMKKADTTSGGTTAAAKAETLGNETSPSAQAPIRPQGRIRSLKPL